MELTKLDKKLILLYLMALSFGVSPLVFSILLLIFCISYIFKTEGKENE